MKIRTDFVTNSSSSSFIIRKSEKFKTEDDLFKFIQGLYRQFLNRYEAAKVYAEKIGHPIGVDEYHSIDFLDADNMSWDITRKYCNMIKKRTKFDSFYYHINFEGINKFLSYNSYEDYCKENPNDNLFKALDDLGKWDKDVIKEWYSNKRWCPEYFIADEDKIEDILKECFIIYDEEGGPYHFHDIADELGKECISHCTHMG